MVLGSLQPTSRPVFSTMVASTMTTTAAGCGCGGGVCSSRSLVPTTVPCLRMDSLNSRRMVKDSRCRHQASRSFHGVYRPTSRAKATIGFPSRKGKQRQPPAALLHEEHPPEWILDCETAKSMLDGRTCLFVDMRSAEAYDYEHITKPPRMTVNIPYEGDMDDYVARIQRVYPAGTTTQKLLLVCTDGEIGIDIARMLHQTDNSTTRAYGVRGGYQGWMQQFTTSGRRRIVGTFVSSGKEALKSGLNLGSEVASTYEENWGRPELSLPSNRSTQPTD